MGTIVDSDHRMRFTLRAASAAIDSRRITGLD
jgi:hypothetical protein